MLSQVVEQRHILTRGHKVQIELDVPLSVLARPRITYEFVLGESRQTLLVF